MVSQLTSSKSLLIVLVVVSFIHSWWLFLAGISGDLYDHRYHCIILERFWRTWVLGSWKQIVAESRTTGTPARYTPANYQMKKKVHDAGLVLLLGDVE